MFGIFPIRTSTAIDNKPSLLPLEILFAQMRKFAHPKAGLKEGPDNEAFIKRLIGIGEPVAFIPEWFSFV